MSFKVVTEIVSGDCPSCDMSTLLVNIGKTNYRCVHCGETLEQKINGVIKYIFDFSFLSISTRSKKASMLLKFVVLT